MDMKAWRSLKNLTLAAAAGQLGIGGANPSRTLQRYETGEIRVDVPFVEKVAALTEGAVTHDDFFRARRAWLAERAQRTEAA